MHRRILEKQYAGRYFDIRLDELQDRAAAGDEGVLVDEAGVDVLESAQRVEVVLGVVVDRQLVAQALEHGIGIGVEFDVVRS